MAAAPKFPRFSPLLSFKFPPKEWIKKISPRTSTAVSDDLNTSFAESSLRFRSRHQSQPKKLSPTIDSSEYTTIWNAWLMCLTFSPSRRPRKAIFAQQPQHFADFPLGSAADNLKLCA
jgi:hypothetical protein